MLPLEEADAATGCSGHRWQKRDRGGEAHLADARRLLAAQHHLKKEYGEATLRRHPCTSGLFEDGTLN
jgi:hypothetical protein